MNETIMADRHAHYSQQTYGGSVHLEHRSSRLPPPLLHGSRDMHDTAHGRSPLTPSSATQSATYQNHDSNRPSLPSLRTVLGESARSPPATPYHHGASLQPLPREPVYDQSTYKPLALYPNKRTRTDSGWDGHGADRKNSDNTSTSLPYLNNHQDDRATSQQQLELPTLSNSSPNTYHHRHSEPTMESRRMPRSHHASPEFRGRPVHGPASPRLALPLSYDSQTRIHHANAHPTGPYRDVDMDGYGRGNHERPTTMSSRSPSTTRAEDNIRNGPAYRTSESHQTFQHDGQRRSLMPAGHSPGYGDDYANMNRYDGSHSYNGASYPYGQAFFVPSHYEYQNGKSRKRSNLPKQSTEIMKRWFDENLHNPYPSEEQKRHFAAAAGINLTQVSNWFINHRRRCPELREKRDKGRAGSRDESV